MIRKYAKFIALLSAIFLLNACSSVGKYVLPTHRFVGAVIVSKDVNPNAQNRPSPISVYFFQLKGTDTFNSSDFFSLYNNPEKTLGKDYVDMGKIDLAPGSQTEINFALNDDTKYVGVIAGYQRLPQAVWRAVVPMNSWGKERVYVRVNRLAISMQKLDGDDSSSTDLGSLADQAKGAADDYSKLSGSSGSSGGSSGDSSGGSSWADKASSALGSSSSSSSGSSTSSGSSSSSSDSSSSGGIVQEYNNAKSAFSGDSKS